MTPEAHGLPQAALDRIRQLAVALLEQDRLDDAEKLFWALHVLEPEDFHVLTALGMLALERADARTALRMLTRARRAAPTLVEAHVNLGQAYLRAGLAERALETFAFLFDGNLGKFAPENPHVRRARVLAAAAGHALRKAEAEVMARRPAAAVPTRVSKKR